MNLQDRPVTILGAGIGGLAAATAFARRGARVSVIEAAPELSEVGAGLQISPNGMAVLDALGLGPAMRQSGIEAGDIALIDGPSGRGVAHLPLDPARAGGRPYLLMHRADLLEILARAARDAGCQIRLGTRVEAVSEGPAGVTLDLSDGREIVDFLIGADGVKSRVRPVLNGDDAPFFTGQVAWRALVPGGDMPARAEVHMGPGRHLVRYPLRGGTLTNIVAVEERSTWAEEGWHHPDDPAVLQRAFAGFGGDVRAQLAQVPEVRIWGLFRHPVARNWHGGQIALLGDAAHPTLPFLAQGANLALEDAWVLAQAMDSLPRAGALEAYQSARRPRVARAIATANGNARNYHLRNPLLRRGAHLGLGALSSAAPGLLVGRFDWLYGHDVTQGAAATSRGA